MQRNSNKTTRTTRQRPHRFAGGAETTRDEDDDPGVG
jgi:hypothetical protein